MDGKRIQTLDIDTLKLIKNDKSTKKPTRDILIEHFKISVNMANRKLARLTAMGLLDADTERMFKDDSNRWQSVYKVSDLGHELMNVLEKVGKK